MGGTTNLSPGSTAPKTGKYKCEFCGEGGMASFFAKSLKEQGLGLNVTQLEGTSRQSTMRFFEAGKTLPECPTCGPATGWFGGNSQIQHFLPQGQGRLSESGKDYLQQGEDPVEPREIAQP